MNELTPDEIREQIASVPYWWHRIEVHPGIFTPGMDNTPVRVPLTGLPDSLEGLRVLDVGACDGFFSFECERRGATVTAWDVIGPDVSGFSVAHRLRRSTVTHRQGSVYQLDPASVGQFDLVLCLGVLYHLRHPLLALDRLHSVCRDRLIVESQICDDAFIGPNREILSLSAVAPGFRAAAIAQFYPGDELNHDPTNWWSPTQTALVQMIETSGFEPRVNYSDGVRCVVHARKTPRRADIERDVAGEQWNLVEARQRIASLEDALRAARPHAPQGA